MASKLISTNLFKFHPPSLNNSILQCNVYSGSNNIYATILELSAIDTDATNSNVTILEDVDFKILDYFNRMFLVEEMIIKECND